MLEKGLPPSGTVLQHIFKQNCPQWIWQEGAKELTPETFCALLQSPSENLTLDQRATRAAHIIDTNPSVLDHNSVIPALDLVYTTDNKPLFDALKKHGNHLDLFLQEHSDLYDYTCARFATTVPHC